MKHSGGGNYLAQRLVSFLVPPVHILLVVEDERLSGLRVPQLASYATQGHALKSRLFQA